VSQPHLDGLLGTPADDVVRRLGGPAVDRAARGERWLRFDGEGWSLRVRIGEDARVASWTLTLPQGTATLRAAAEPVGLWPACAPDGSPGDAPLLRRRLPSPAGRPDHTLTATVREGRVIALTAFDEPPDWELPDRSRR
jgi:hypothetical protein